MPAVCSVCYHTFKHKYGLDQVQQKSRLIFYKRRKKGLSICQILDPYFPSIGPIFPKYWTHIFEVLDPYLPRRTNCPRSDCVELLLESLDKHMEEEGGWIIIMITRPWPAFGRQGLEGSSFEYSYTRLASRLRRSARSGIMTLGKDKSPSLLEPSNLPAFRPSNLPTFPKTQCLKTGEIVFLPFLDTFQKCL